MSSSDSPRSLCLQRGSPGRSQDRRGPTERKRAAGAPPAQAERRETPCLQAHRHPAGSVWDEGRFRRHRVGTGLPGYTLTKWASAPRPASLSVTACQELQD